MTLANNRIQGPFYFFSLGDCCPNDVAEPSATETGRTEHRSHVGASTRAMASGLGAHFAQNEQHRDPHAAHTLCNNARVIALMFLHLLMTTPSPDAERAERSLWLLERAGWQREETALLEALRIYTRDLHLAITFSMIPSEAETADAQREVARERCSSEVALVAWFSGDSRTPVLNLIHCASQVADELPAFPQNDLHLSAQTLALKIRGSLARETIDALGPASAGLARRPPSGPDAALPFDQDVAGTSARTNDPRPGSEGLAKRPAGPVPGVPMRSMENLEVGLAYGVSSTANWEGAHQGVSLRVALSLASLPLAIEADATWGTAVDGRATDNQASLRDVPIGVALSRRWERRRWRFSCGPRLSLHLIQAEGSSPDGRNGAMLSYSAGFGTLEQVRYEFWGGLSLQAALIDEILVPRRRFTVDGHATAQAGFLQWGLFVGAVYRFL